MKRLSPLGFVLTGCAMTPAGIYRTPVELTVPSTKTSQAFAVCVAERLLGGNANVLRNEGDHYWITRDNGANVPIVRWDFLPAAAGSIAELRTTVHIGGTAADKVRACA